MEIKLIQELNLSQLLPKRDRHSNKVSAGRTILVSGSHQFQGAGVLSALAATRSGSGYTYLCSPGVRYPWVKIPDIIHLPAQFRNLHNFKSEVIVLGPGVKETKAISNWIQRLIKEGFSNVILDAGALNLLAEMPSQHLPESWILTPHEGEAARLLGRSSAWVKAHRKLALLELERNYGCHIVLKGYETLLKKPHSKIFILKSEPSLSKAGTGDVLAGIIGGLRAQKLAPFEAMALGVYIHSYCARYWKHKNKADELSLRPTDLVEVLPECLKNIRTGKYVNYAPQSSKKNKMK